MAHCLVYKLIAELKKFSQTSIFSKRKEIISLIKNEEIKKKFDKGYPSDNILFEASQTAVLYQHGEGVMRPNMEDEEQTFPPSLKPYKKGSP